MDFGSEFVGVLGEVEDVDGRFTFGVDEGCLDVAVEGMEDQGNFTEEAGGVLGDNLQQG